MSVTTECLNLPETEEDNGKISLGKNWFGIGFGACVLAFLIAAVFFATLPFWLYCVKY